MNLRMLKKVPQELLKPDPGSREMINLINILLSKWNPAGALVLLAVFSTANLRAQGGDKLLIPAGSFHSVLPEVVGEPVRVDSFYLDEVAVTNEDFLEFLQANPRWTRSGIPALYAGSDYLRHWKEDLDPSAKNSTPVTRVSWFAANSYCKWAGGRLPTLNEWEYSAQALDISDAELDRFSFELMGWYSAVDANQAAPVGSTGIENRYGVKDQFGLIMEWVEDFKPVLGSEISLDCGTVGRMQNGSGIYSYAASVRYITRMSFNAKSTTGMLGFRCAYDIDQTKRLEEQLP